MTAARECLISVPNLTHRLAKIAEEVRIWCQQHARVVGRQGIFVSLHRPIEGEKLTIALVGCGIDAVTSSHSFASLPMFLIELMLHTHIAAAVMPRSRWSRGGPARSARPAAKSLQAPLPTWRMVPSAAVRLWSYSPASILAMPPVLRAQSARSHHILPPKPFRDFLIPRCWPARCRVRRARR